MSRFNFSTCNKFKMCILCINNAIFRFQVFQSAKEQLKWSLLK